MASVFAVGHIQVPLPYDPKVSIRFQLARDGEVTAGPKYLRVYRGWPSIGSVEMAFYAPGGEMTQAYDVSLAALLEQGDWLACGVDDAVPRKTRAAYRGLNAAGVYAFNITNGDGGAAGSPATLPAAVKVGGVPASREVVVIEKPSDGQWRLAGYGPTPGGDGVIDVRVTDGSLYAIGLDDWGMVFTADLAVAVDQTIRPSVFTGWRYRITEAGTLPAAEPNWWPAEGDNASRLLGTARAIAVRYYQPLAHGPLPVELL